jgi:hypothetical protein
MSFFDRCRPLSAVVIDFPRGRVGLDPWAMHAQLTAISELLQEAEADAEIAYEYNLAAQEMVDDLLAAFVEWAAPS